MKLTLNTVLTRGLAAGVAFGVALPAMSPVLAQDEEQMVEELIVVGSRRRDRSAADSPVPVDVISGDDFRNHGDTDMDSLLASLVPSYNVDQQPISDAGTVIRPASLRGLPSDATLVLVNGKRRHRGSVISFLGGGISDGAHGPDLSAIPAVALDRVEVLRDGASAQYGSDAIAGVLNLVLREDSSGGSVEAKWGRTGEGDGEATTLAANLGLPLMDTGFINLSMEYKQADPTSRSVQRGDAAGLIAAGNSNVRQPAAQIWGAPEIRDDVKLFANLGFDVGESSEIYAFGNWAQRTVEGGFFFRNPHTRGGVFRGPFFDAAGDDGSLVSWDGDTEAWYYHDGLVQGGSLTDGTVYGDANAATVATVKVADVGADAPTRTDAYGATVYSRCPQIVVTGNVADPAGVSAVAADPNCFSFIERFPGGFTPQFGGDVDDLSFAVGLRGEMANGWFYDVSGVWGTSKVEHFMHNTINPQLAGQGVNIPTTYFPGTYTETDRVFDINLSKALEGLGREGAPLHVALGFEWRDETFEREAGDMNSWFIDTREGGLADQGFGIGSNGFPGLAPRHAGENTRGSYAAYIDLETDLTDNFLVGGALRYENYEDFGNTVDGKLTGRLQIADNFAVRGAISTGFRAPTVGQSNVRNVTTAFNNGMLADEATLPPTHPIAVQKGASPLEPEESVNATVGAVFNVGQADVTLDYYHITVEGRIARTSFLALTPADLTALDNLGVADASSFAGVLFFTNDFDTTTKGVDLVVTMPVDLMEGDTDLVFVANRNNTTVDKRNPAIIDDLRVEQLKNTLPGNRMSLTANHTQGPWRFMGRYRHYGEFYGAPANVQPWGSTYDARWFLDAEAAFEVGNGLTFVVGGQNLLDEYPEETSQSAQGGVGMLYPENSPYGFNGAFYYFRAIWDFN